MSDAIMEGMLLGTLGSNIDKDVEIASLEKTVAKLESVLEAEKEAHMRTIASRDGFKALSTEIVRELQNPDKPRYLSDPENKQGRQRFFDEKREEAHRRVKLENSGP